MILKNPGGDWRGVLRFGVLNRIQLLCVNFSDFLLTWRACLVHTTGSSFVNFSVVDPDPVDPG